MHIPTQRVPADVQRRMGIELAEATDRILAKYDLKPGEHSVPLLAGVLWGQAKRFGWRTPTLVAYCLQAFEQMVKESLGGRAG